MLSFGELIGLRWLVNPLLAGLGVWLTYRLGSKLFGSIVGLLAAGLTVTSPFFLMNSGTLLSHPWGLVLSTGMAVAWLDTLDEDNPLPGWVPTLSAGLCLGVLALSRPFTALGIAIPLGIHGFITLFRGTPRIKKRVLAVGVITVLVGSLHILWQYAVTGDPLLNPYILWWEYDKIGFGPGVGVTQQGHNLKLALQNLKISLNAGYQRPIWMVENFMAVYPLWVMGCAGETKILASVKHCPGTDHPIHGILDRSLGHGPALLLRGTVQLDYPDRRRHRLAGRLVLSKREIPLIKLRKVNPLRPRVVTALVILLVAGNLIFYVPRRIGEMKGLFGTSRQQLKPFDPHPAEVSTPALILVDTDEWRAYAGLLELANPMLDSPFIFIWDRGPRSSKTIINAFQDRTPYFYFPTEPENFYRIKP